MTSPAWFPRTTSGTNTWSLREIAAAQQDFSATYSVFNSISADFSGQYSIALSGEWATITINATIVLVAERPFTASYTILNSVSADFSGQYFLDGVPPTPPLPVFQDFAVVYAVDSEIATIEVYQDFLALWSAAGIVYQDFPSDYYIIQDTTNPGWTEVPSVSETWTSVSAPVDTWTPVTNPTGSWN